MADKARRKTHGAVVLVVMLLLAWPAVAEDPIPLPWRGVLIGADHTSPAVHHDNVYVQIGGGPTAYYTSTPARQEGSALVDPGILFHIFTRDTTPYTVYVTSSYSNGLESELSEGLTIQGDYIGSSSCTEQTVPVADAGEDQVVTVGTSVTLDATDSHDPYSPDTPQLSYRWEPYSAPEAVTLSPDAQTPVTGFTPTTVGNYYFRLTVRDEVWGASFNRSPPAYVRVSAVLDRNDPNLLHADAGRPRQVEVGQFVTLDGGRSVGPSDTTYRWEQTNPIGARELQSMAASFGTTDCNGACYKTNFDANSVVDGKDVALLANNWGPATIAFADRPIAQFLATVARPHIFRLSLNDGIAYTEDTTIVAVHHPDVAEVVTPPPFDPLCSP
jgi:hypothetical protein